MNTSSGGTRKRFSRAQQEQWVAQCISSRLSQREFARQHHLRLSTLQRWIAQSRGKAWAGGGATARPAKAVPTFIELKPSVGSASWAAEVVRSNGLTIRLAHDVPTVLLQTLLGSC